jgi:hypothetical protein
MLYRESESTLRHRLFLCAVRCCAVLSNSAINNPVVMDDQRRAELAGSPARH